MSRPRVTSREWRTVTILSLGFGLVGIDRFLISTMYPTIAHELGLGFCVTSKTHVRTARLKVGAIRARADLPIAAAVARQPDFEIVGFRGTEADVAGAEQHRAMRESEIA